MLGYWLLPHGRLLGQKTEPVVARWAKSFVKRLLEWTLPRSTYVLLAVSIGVAISCLAILGMGGEFLPTLNEGTLTVSLRLDPGTSLEESVRVASQVEKTLFEIPEVLSVARRTGRAELDEHAEGVNSSEIDVGLIENKIARPGALAMLMRLVPIAHLWGY